MEKCAINKMSIRLLFVMAVAGILSHFLFGFSHDDMAGHAWGSDDAYISYRYAANFASGHGLVYNKDEKVEGYTNFLYVLIAAFIWKLNPGFVFYGCFVLNCFAFLATLWLFFRYLQLSHVQDSAYALAIVCLCPLISARDIEIVSSSPAVNLDQFGITMKPGLASEANA